MGKELGDFDRGNAEPEENDVVAIPGLSLSRVCARAVDKKLNQLTTYARVEPIHSARRIGRKKHSDIRMAGLAKRGRTKKAKKEGW